MHAISHIRPTKHTRKLDFHFYSHDTTSKQELGFKHRLDLEVIVQNNSNQRRNWKLISRKIRTRL